MNQFAMMYAYEIREDDVQQGYPLKMFTMTLNEIKQAIGDDLIEDNSLDDGRVIRGINTDSRTVKPGELFVALKGENFDAHDFISSAQDRGAAGYIVDHKIDFIKPALVVKDTRAAFGKIASAWRNKFKIPVVAVTGSNGKTTVKEMLYSILSTQGKVLATKGNFNNDIGVPITLYRMKSAHDSAVIEMGANHRAEISYLTQLVKPDVAIITNAAAAHLEGFGSLEGVAKAKGEIFEGLNSNGTAILNYDDANFSYWASLVSTKKILSFGKDNNADVSYVSNGLGNSIIIQVKGYEYFELDLPLLGEHNRCNALAAIAASIALDIPAVHIKQGLELIKAVPGRLEKKQGINNSLVVDDTYNANPASLKAAVESIEHLTLDDKVKCHVVLGDMGELGDNAIAEHKNSSDILNKSNVNYLYSLGKYSEYTSDNFTGSSRHFSSHGKLLKELKNNIKENDVVLVKGSRSMQMEKIVNSICAEQGVLTQTGLEEQ